MEQEWIRQKDGTFKRNPKYKKKQYVKKDDGTFEIAPVRKVVKDAPQSNERTWFQKSKGNLGQTILGTADDVNKNKWEFLIGAPEKIAKGFLSFGATLNEQKQREALNYQLMYGAYNGANEEELKKTMQSTEKFIDDVYTETGKTIAKDWYDEKPISQKVAEASPIGMLAKATGTNSEDYSVLGERSDALVQSASQLALTAGLQAVGVPWWVTTGSLAYGGEMENALQQGASFHEAQASGLITAGAEILTEKLSGGIKFGGSTLDDLTIKPLLNKISSKAVRTLANYTTDVVGEGLEEVASSVISNLGTALYKEENLSEILASEQAIDGYIESFIGGMVLSGGMNSGKAVNSIKTGRDYNTGLTENEQKVLDKAVEQRIKEAEQGGKRLSKQEKTEIEQDVLNSLKRGEIDIDTIEREFGGESYTAFDSLKKESDEFSTLYETPSEKLSEKQKDRLAELKAKNTENSYENRLFEARSKLTQDVQKVTEKDGFIREAYGEKTRKSEAFKVSEEESKKYSEKEMKIVNKAVESGIINNTRKSHDLVNLIAKLHNDKNVDFDFANNEKLKESGFAIEGKTIDGFKQGNSVTINLQSKKALNTVVGHEITHVLEGTDMYQALQKTVIEYAKTQGVYDAKYKDIVHLYRNQFQDNDLKKRKALYDGEVTADLVGEYIFSDIDFVRNLSTKNPNVFQKVYNEIKYMLKVATAGSDAEKQLLKAKKIFEDVYRDTKMNTSDKTQLMISGTSSMTYDEGNYHNALALEKEGKSKDEIFEETGWFKGQDSKWRYEFDDSKMELKEGRIAIGNWDNIRLDEIIKHDNLFEAYPYFKKMKVKIENLGRNVEGNFNPNSFEITLNSDMVVYRPSDAKITLAHEIQHAIQEIEGFAKGSNTEYWQMALDNGFDSRPQSVKNEEKALIEKYFELSQNDIDFVIEMEELMSTTPTVARGQINWETLEKIEDDPIEWQEYDRKRDALEEKYGTEKVLDFYDLKYDMEKFESKGIRDKNQLYYDTAGEVEARDVENRLNMTEEERKSKIPYSATRKDVVFADRRGSAGEETQYSIAEIVDDNGQSFGIGVRLDSTLLDGLSPKERVEMVKEYVHELGGSVFTAYDSKGNKADIRIAEKNERFKNKSGKKIPVNKNLTNKFIDSETKQEAITLIDELVETAEYTNSEKSRYTHDWLDNNSANDWEYWDTYVEDKNGDIWKVTLNVANTTEGEKILYDINKIKKVGQSIGLDTSTTSTDTISEVKEDVKRKYSLSDNQSIAPIKNGIYSEDVLLERTIAPVREDHSGEVTEMVAEQSVESDNMIAPLKTSTPQAQSIAPPIAPEQTEQVENDIFNEMYAPVTEEEANAMLDSDENWERLRSLQEVEEPQEIDEPAYDNDVQVNDPFEDRDIKEVGKRNVNAYMYDNPEVKPFYQEEARIMLGELQNTVKGERFYNDQLYYDTNGEQGFSGTSRMTSDEIAELLDNYNYSYAEIEKGLKAIIEDHGAENIAVAKRIEFFLNERLLNGHTDFQTGIEIPRNQDYVNLLESMQVNQSHNVDVDLAPSINFGNLETTDRPIAPVREVHASEPLPLPTGNEVRGVRMNAEQKQGTPRTTERGNLRSWAETSTESEVVNREILPKDLDQSKIYYEPISNRQTLNTANADLNRMGYDKALEVFNAKLENRTVSLSDIALGERLVQESLKRGDTKTTGELIQNIAILGTELGQKVQALSIIQRMTPEGQLKMLQKVVNRGKAKGDKVFDNVEITQEMIDKILAVYGQNGTYDQNKLNEAVEQVKQEIADQMSVSVMDKVNAWRYLAMLGNPKTHIRNVVSNITMQATTEIKDVIARTTETIAPIKNRTKTWKVATEDVKKFAKQSTAEAKEVLTSENSYSEVADIKAKREIFKTQILQKVYDFNNDWMTKEDWFFKKSRYRRSLQEFLTANGIKTQEDIQNNPEIVEKGKKYATEQAQIATFQQMSWLANKINEIERKNVATQVGVGAVLPFKKTPINIAKTGLAYSPLGFAKSLTYDLYQMKQGKTEASQVVDNLAKGVTGSALVYIGYMLAMSGLLNGGGEDDKEGKYDYQLGKQSYSLNYGGSTYSLNWLTPVAMPLFIGANAFEMVEEDKELSFDTTSEALAQTLDPLSEMSFLSSLDSVLTSYESGMGKFAGIGETMLQNYATQFAPTLLSQVAQVTDDTKRNTQVAGDSNARIVEQTINKLKYKIPGLRQTLEPTIDIWGNEVKQTENMIGRVVETFIAPYTRKDSIATEIDEEIKEVYSQTGDNSVIPTVPNKKVQFKDETYKMSAKEYTDYKTVYGQLANETLEDLFRTSTYQNSDADYKAELLSRAYKYASDEAKKDYLAKEGVEYTNTTEDNVPVYKADKIKGAIENDMTLEEFDLYNRSHGKYYISQIVGGYDTYKSITSSLGEIEADKKANGSKINGSKKKKVVQYLNNANVDYYTKIIMFKAEYPDDDRYNSKILEYIKGLDMSYQEKIDTLTELGFKVTSDGKVRW